MIISGQQTPDVLSEMEEGIVRECLARGLDCFVIPPLYHVAENSPLWDELGKRVEPGILFCGLHPRPAEWLLRRHGIAGQAVTIVDLRSFTDAASALATVQGSSEASPGRLERFDESCRSRWYPVVDGSRCTGCLNCLQFCLFGVYEQDAQGRPTVRHPDQCKPGCPACSRVCPQSAIMFPLYERDPAIAGAPGQWVKLDAAARKMFYARTRQPCPVCGRTAGSPLPSGALAADSLCPECGRPRPDPAPAGGAAPAAEPLPFDDLDELVEQLDQKTQRRG
jgi:Pyruvate/2-oxoacid:ferredoxin oxidoreductase delta subunit